MISTILVAVITIAVLVWLITAAVLGITARLALCLLFRFTWQAGTLAAIGALAIYALPALLSRIAYLARTFF